MTLRQGIILNLEVYKITGERLDVGGFTKTCTLNSNSNIINMGMNYDGRFYIVYDGVVNRKIGNGFREQFPLFSSPNPETIEIGGMKYSKQDVEEALKYIKPIK